MEQILNMLTEKVLLERKDLIHSRAVSLILTVFSKRVIRILWSVVLNAALRSNKINITDSPESTEVKMSFNTLSRAVSVLWLVLNPDWNFSKISFWTKKACN